MVESKVSDPRGRLVRLIQYLQDEAKELVESCSYLPAAEGYERAKDLLKRQYGDQYPILSQYRKELKQWPKIRSHDAKGFRRFYSFLMKYKATMISLKSPIRGWTRRVYLVCRRGDDPTYSKLALQDFKDETPPKYGFKKDIKSFLTNSSSKQYQICA